MSIILCGPQGVGKSTYGKLLSDRLGYQFIDSDALLKEYYQLQNQSRNSDAKLTMTDIYQHLGESGFRQLEHQALKSYDWPERYVLATGGGVMTYEPSRQFLSNLGRIIFLNADLKLLGNRYLKRTNKPAYITNKGSEKSGLEQFLTICQQRETDYLAVANQVVNVNAAMQTDTVLAHLSQAAAIKQEKCHG